MSGDNKEFYCLRCKKDYETFREVLVCMYNHNKENKNEEGD